MLSRTGPAQQNSVWETKGMTSRSIVEVSEVVPDRIPLLEVPGPISLNLIVEPPRVPMLSGIVHILIDIHPGRMGRNSPARCLCCVSFVIPSRGKRPNKIVGVLL